MCSISTCFTNGSYDKPSLLGYLEGSGRRCEFDSHSKRAMFSNTSRLARGCNECHYTTGSKRRTTCDCVSHHPMWPRSYLENR